jgi:hypothetical protein
MPTSSNQYSLVVDKNGTGSGTVTSNPAGINCGQDCQEDYNLGTLVTLTATPQQGSNFVRWEGDCSGTSPTCQLTMNKNKNVTAVFNSQEFVLYINVRPSGSGIVTINPGGYSCNSENCSFVYTTSTPITLTASSSRGYVFKHWEDGCSDFGTNPVCQFTIRGNVIVTAVFDIFGRIREIIPFNPPSLNQFIKQTAVIIFGWR